MRFQGAVYGFALTKVRDCALAQELTQEVFVHAMRKIGQLRDLRCFAGWLRRITARMAINKLTRRGIPVGAPEALEGVAAAAVDPLDAIVRTEVRTTVRAALKRLKAIDRTASRRSTSRGSRSTRSPIGSMYRWAP